jgi:hypothetical protein
VAGLVPEVVVDGHAVAVVFPAAGDIEVLVQQQKPARRSAFAIAEHGDHDLAVGQAMDGVRPAQVGLRPDLLRLDNLVDSGSARVGDVHDVNPAGEEARSDQKPA